MFMIKNKSVCYITLYGVLDEPGIKWVGIIIDPFLCDKFTDSLGWFGEWVFWQMSVLHVMGDVDIVRDWGIGVIKGWL